MKKLALIIGLSLSLFSCSTPDTPSHSVIITGSKSKDGIISINDKAKELAVTYEAYSGETIKYYDPGTETNVWPITYSDGTHGTMTTVSHHDTVGFIYVDGVLVKTKALSSSSMYLTYVIP